MTLTRSLATVVAATAVVAAGTLPAQADHLGTTSLAAVLAADGDTFDTSWKDYDVATEAVGAVLAAKPGSAVGVLADGTVPVTAFLPDDQAFRLLVEDLTGSAPATEQEAFAAVAGLGIDTVEAVLLYHVVPGATIDSATAATADGASLSTALGAPLTVDVRGRAGSIRLADADTSDADAALDKKDLDLNEGNLQIAHGISRVLRPIDLP